MKSKVKKILLWSGAVFGFLVLVLVIHIYIVTRPKPADEHTRAMARIDIKQPIDSTDAVVITKWLYEQKGIDHVLVNPKTDIVIFTFFPVKTTANQIVSDFKSSLNYKAERFVPTAAQLQSGCPVAFNSLSYKVAKYFKQIF